MNTFSRWWEVTRREFRAGVRRPANWVLLVILALMALGLSEGSVTVSTGESTVGGERPYITSVYTQSMLQSIIMLALAAWFLAISCGMVVIRDLELQVTEVFHSTRLTPREYAWGKFAGAVALFVAIWLVYVGLTIFFAHVVEGTGSSDVIGPFAFASTSSRRSSSGCPRSCSSRASPSSSAPGRDVRSSSSPSRWWRSSSP